MSLVFIDDTPGGSAWRCDQCECQFEMLNDKDPNYCPLCGKTNETA